MNNEKLNNLVMTFQKTREDDCFNEIYREVIVPLVPKFPKIARSLRADEHEVAALYEDVLLKCIDTYEETSDFLRYFKSCVVRARTDLYRKKKTRHSRELLTDESDAATFEFVDEYDVLKTTEADQRQLIGSLTKKANDATTTAIVEAFLAADKPTPTTIGRQLGLHHSTVTRKLQRLAKHFDDNLRAIYAR